MMKALGIVIALAMAAAGSVGGASADPWKDESGHGKWGHYYGYEDQDYDYDDYERDSYKEEYRVGNCKVERKWDDDEYKEEVKCKRGYPAYGYYPY